MNWQSTGRTGCETSAVGAVSSVYQVPVTPQCAATTNAVRLLPPRPSSTYGRRASQISRGSNPVVPTLPGTSLRAAIAALIIALFSAPAVAQSHADVVAAVKADLESRHVDLSGACGALAITRRVAWQLRDEGAGLLAKPTGNQCESRAVDILVYKDGHGFDVLRDAGGENGPTWNPVAIENGAARWLAPQDPGDAPIPSPVPAPVPAFDPTEILQRLDQLQAALMELDSRTHADTEHQRVWLNAIDGRMQVLEARPIVTGCKARANLGFARIPVSCEVQ